MDAFTLLYRLYSIMYHNHIYNNSYIKIKSKYFNFCRYRGCVYPPLYWIIIANHNFHIIVIQYNCGRFHGCVYPPLYWLLTPLPTALHTGSRLASHFAVSSVGIDCSFVCQAKRNVLSPYSGFLSNNHHSTLMERSAKYQIQHFAQDQG